MNFHSMLFMSSILFNHVHEQRTIVSTTSELGHRDDKPHIQQQEISGPCPLDPPSESIDHSQ